MAGTLFETRTCSRCGQLYNGEPRSTVCWNCKSKVEDLRAVHGGHRFGQKLSNRERQVVALVVAGKRNKEIAWDLRIEEGTIKVYMSHIFIKTGVTGRVLLVLWAQSHPDDVVLIHPAAIRRTPAGEEPKPPLS